MEVGIEVKQFAQVTKVVKTEYRFNPSQADFTVVKSESLPI